MPASPLCHLGMAGPPDLGKVKELSACSFRELRELAEAEAGCNAFASAPDRPNS